MKNILCVCFGNTCRTPMVEALVNDMGMDVKVQSAGIGEFAQDRDPANEKAVKAMSEIGKDISGHRSTWIGELNLSEFDLILTVGPKEATMLREMAPAATVLIVGGDELSNPYEKGQKEYNDTRDAIIEWLAQESDNLRKILE